MPSDKPSPDARAKAARKPSRTDAETKRHGEADTQLIASLDSFRPVTQRFIQEGEDLKTLCSEVVAELVPSLHEWLDSIRGVEFEGDELTKIGHATRHLVYCHGLHLLFANTPVAFGVGRADRHLGMICLSPLGTHPSKHIYNQAAVPPLSTTSRSPDNAPALIRPPAYPSSTGSPVTAQYIESGRRLRATLHREQTARRVIPQLHRWLQSVEGIKFPLTEGERVGTIIRQCIQAAGRLLAYENELVSLSVAPTSRQSKNVSIRLYRQSSEDRTAYAGVRMPKLSSQRP